MNKNKVKIAIVEDSTLHRKVIVKHYKKLGYTNVVEFSDPAEAWESIVNAQLSDDPFQLISTDLNMPEMDGMDLIRNIKNDSMSASLKILVITAEADMQVKAEALSYGASEYLVKPIDPEDLEKCLNNLLVSV